MTTLAQLLIKIDPDSKGVLTPTILITVDIWLSWWERNALDHLKWVQKKGLDSAAAMGRLHQIQEIRVGLTDKQSLDVPDSIKGDEK